MKMRPSIQHIVALLAIAAVATSCGYLKTNPPPDAEKDSESQDHTSWLAAAANLLADAGYGYGRTVQDRADRIYGDLVGHFSTDATGWTDAALQWWLESDFNVWPDNPYKLVRVYGNKRPVLPWNHPEGSSFIGEQLRQGNLVAASISWPASEGDIQGVGGHVLSCWGDDLKLKAPALRKPGHLRVTDSGRSLGGIIQTYRYDDYRKPNPNGYSLGPGWYISYDHNHPFIKNIVILSRQMEAVEDKLMVESLISLRMVSSETDASGFAAGIACSQALGGLKVEVLREKRKNIIEDQYPKILYNYATIDFDFLRNPVPKGQSIVVNWELITAPSPVITLQEVILKQPAQSTQDSVLPELSLGIESMDASPRSLRKDFTGGYILGSADLLLHDPENSGHGQVTLLRFVLQYPYDENPERHALVLNGSPNLEVSSIRLGHSYGMISTDSLWNYDKWITYIDQVQVLSGEAQRIDINWTGLLPYPKGEDLSRKVAEIPQ